MARHDFLGRSPTIYIRGHRPLHIPGPEANGSEILQGIAYWSWEWRGKSVIWGMKEVSAIFLGVNTAFITVSSRARHIQGKWWWGCVAWGR